MKLLPVFALKMGGAALPKMTGSQCVLCQGFRSSTASAESGLPTTYCFIAEGGMEEWGGTDRDCVVSFATGLLSVNQTGLEFTAILLPWPPRVLDSRYWPLFLPLSSTLACEVLVIYT